MQVEDFGPFTLSKGSHADATRGMCVMEMVSFLAGEKWSDTPVCSSPVVATFCQVINDRFEQDIRDKLQTYVPRLIGTASPEHDQERAEYLALTAIRVFAPIALRAAGLDDHADILSNFEGGLNAADAAANAAAADAYAAANVKAPLFEVLDGLLAIGPSGSTYTQQHVKRAERLRAAVAA